MQKTHKKLAIIGAGGHGKVVAATALAAARWTEIVFLDDEAEGEILGLPVICCTGLAGMGVLPAEYDLAVAVGGNAVRERLCRRFAALGFSLPVIIHPTAVIAPDVEIGAGSVVIRDVDAQTTVVSVPAKTVGASHNIPAEEMEQSFNTDDYTFII